MAYVIGVIVAFVAGVVLTAVYKNKAIAEAKALAASAQLEARSVAAKL
jgi:uncharacterized membrane protein (DUF485 family)